MSDLFSHRIVGWRASTSQRSDLALDALDPLEHALWNRGGAGPSRVARGLLRHAAAESVFGLYKTELSRRQGPWRGLDDVEIRTLEWVD